jgi:serine/threonine protein phosphatase PrpC
MTVDDTDKITVDVNNSGNDSERSEPNVTQEAGWNIDKGMLRENNEDSVATVILNQASEGDSQSVGVYAVADGMGGHEAGEVASKLAVRTAVRQLMNNVTELDADMPDNYRRWLESAATLANRVVHQNAQDTDKKMGSTLVMAVVVGHDVHVVNVGDSRAYLISTKDIRQITHDQSFVQALVDNGTITPEQAAGHPNRNVLTQAIGSHEEVSAELFSETLEADESLLLCSDGLWEMLGDTEIARIVRSAETPDTACQALIEACNAAGGRDNIAAVLVRLGTLPQPAGNANRLPK